MPETLPALAKREGYDGVAITDRYVMHGYPAFAKACRKEGMRAIFGLQMDILWEEEGYCFYIYAQNDTGYQELVLCSSEYGLNKKPLALSWIQDHMCHCALLIPLEKGVLEEALANRNEAQALHILEQIKSLFPVVAIASGNPRSQYWRSCTEWLRPLCRKIGIPQVIASLAAYSGVDQQDAYQVMEALDQDKTIDDTSLHFGTQMHLLSGKEYAAMDEDLKRATEAFADTLRVDGYFRKARIPSYPLPDGISSDAYLKQLCMKGLQKRMQGNPIPDSYKERLCYELDVIRTMGFSDYFLIVWDFILFARRNDIYVGPGRGSAAGSLVAYCLGITHLDPLKHQLLFERFLNPERVTMPDIDVDFPDNRRDEVIHYIMEKYGQAHAAHIITYGTMGAKQVLRDVGRVLKLPAASIDVLAKCVPQGAQGAHVSLDEAYQRNPRFRQLIESDAKYARVFHIAKKLEGLPRHRSVHAAGIVMSNEPLLQTVPLIALDDGTIVTQYSMEYLEERGLLKMDFLALRNLTTIHEIVTSIRPLIEVDILKIPIDDAASYRLLAQADTVGIFQLESDGIKQLLRKLQPKTFDDIAVAIALYRPGPMENIPLYLENRAHPNRVSYPHRDIEPILRETYGVIVYQEQIMQISQIMAGFSLGKADILRKAMSKKKEKELVGLKEDFLHGCQARGYSRSVAETVYEWILKFANYGFNKSHSVAYALIIYQMAYLKANYPLYFYRSLLNSVIGKEEKTYEYVKECRRRHLSVLAPSVQHSEDSYELEQQALRMPLTVIKGVGSVASRQIVNERQRGGHYADYIDFVLRMQKLKINRMILERLADAGALDDFGHSRKTMKQSLQKVMQYGELVQCEVDGQIEFELQLVPKPSIIAYPDAKQEAIELQKEALGFYLDGHPIEHVKQEYGIRAMTVQQAVAKKGNVQVFVVIDRVREHRTKHGDAMCFISAHDETGDYDFVVMPRLYAAKADVWKKGAYVYLEGSIDDRNSCLVKNVIQYKERREESR